MRVMGLQGRTTTAAYVTIRFLTLPFVTVQARVMGLQGRTIDMSSDASLVAVGHPGASLSNVL